MEVFRPELHAFGLRAYLDVAGEALGEQAVHQLLQRYGVSEQTVNDPEAWFSLDFIEAFIDDLVDASGDPGIVERTARRSIAPKYLGPIYTVVRAFGDVASTYEQVAKSAPRYNKTGTYAIRQLGPSRCELRFSRLPAMRPERTLHMCQNRRFQLATMPTIFGLPPAEIDEPQCMVRGDECCTYDIRWVAPAKRWLSRSGAALGLLIGAGVALAFGMGVVPSAISVCMLGFALWGAGRNLELRRDVADRVQDLVDHQEALTRSMRVNEQRFAELLEAKAEVESKVELRTAELREATARLSTTLEEVRALDRAKTDFFNNVSHELRSPLTLIVAPLEDLVAGRSPPGGEQAALGVMLRNARRLLQLINQLLNLAKIDAGQMTITPVPSDLLALVKQTVGGFEAAARKKEVALSLDAPTQLAPVALDEGWIESAVGNVVANALRASPSGGAVRVQIVDSGADVSISVTDQGPGIALADQGKVFERFAQGDISRQLVGGTGIGLALVREAMRLHRGDVKLVSEPGRGATFTLTIPRGAELAAAMSGKSVRSTDGTAHEARTAGVDVVEGGEASERPGPSPDAPLALVVEDNPELRMFMSDVLAARYRVRSAGNGQEGLELARWLGPDVIVSDVAMPMMDGYGLCRALRAHDETRSIPVVLVTARTELASVLEGFDAGANDYVLKPFHGRELLARVEVHVRLRLMMQQRALQERHAMLGVMAASVAHQVRNPLTSLVGGLPAMRSRLKDKADARTLELIGVMIDCADRIDHLTKDLMDLSRVDREAESSYRPSDGLRSVVRLAQARTGFTTPIEERIEDAPLIDGRPGDISHVFMNLLDNAVRAVPEGEGSILVEGETQGSYYVVRVEDSGAGIDPAYLARIFDPFFTTRAAGQGTGLGLAIARQIILQAGGTIEAGRSRLGGAMFKVRIPVTQRSSIPPRAPAVGRSTAGA